MAIYLHQGYPSPLIEPKLRCTLPAEPAQLLSISSFSSSTKIFQPPFPLRTPRHANLIFISIFIFIFILRSSSPYFSAIVEPISRSGLLQTLCFSLRRSSLSDGVAVGKQGDACCDTGETVSLPGIPYFFSTPNTPPPGALIIIRKGRIPPRLIQQLHIFLVCRSYSQSCQRRDGTSTRLQDRKSHDSLINSMI
ncbi:hypothetical protein F4825DRAFT_414740 [Nemania diffusa]|nr:hypothetical protein F4825DRAFT_414740 [Nemania diffusa]